MRVIIFIGEGYRPEAQLVDIVRLTACRHKTEIIHTFTDFLDALTHPMDPDTVALALLASPEELTAIGPLREISMEIPLILVLPDSQPETIRLGHRLRPRFLGFGQNGFSEVAAVLTEVLKRGGHDAYAER